MGTIVGATGEEVGDEGIFEQDEEDQGLNGWDQIGSSSSGDRKPGRRSARCP